MNISEIKHSCIDLLQQLITIPSFSKEEDKTAACLFEFLSSRGIASQRIGNNIWCANQQFNTSIPTLLLNSHHDTVKPNPGYSRDPFLPQIQDGKLYGLGSNDAGGPLVSLIGAFLHFYGRRDLNFNLVLAATAEEEISGAGGIEKIWPSLPRIDFAIVGEPTRSEVAIAEKGLLVLDCMSRGKAGHAARDEGENAIYLAMKDIDWFRTFQFPKISPVLGKTKMSVTVIQAGQAHNQIPATCAFVVDIRVTDVYTLEEVLETVKRNVSATVTPRSMRLRSSGISEDHPLVRAAKASGRKLYGSPTTSDQALIPAPSVKMGPGDSARSHSADEFILLDEIDTGIDAYIHMVEALNDQMNS